MFFPPDTAAAAKDKPFPPFANVVYHSKDARDFVEKAKGGFTEEEYQFLLNKAADLQPHEMPKAREVRPGTYEFKLQGHKMVVKTVSAAKEIYELNGKKFDFSAMTLEDRYDAIYRMITEKKSASLGRLFFPEANAEGITLALAIIGTTLGIISLAATLWDKNTANCKEISSAAVACLELTGKLQLKVRETANFFITQKKIEQEGAEKSPEIAKQTQEACKDLTSRVSELEVIDYKGKSSLQGIALNCSFDKQTLIKCQKGLNTSSDELKGFVTKYCSPEAVTTSPTVKKANTESATAPDIPVIPDVLRRDTPGTPTSR